MSRGKVFPIWLVRKGAALSLAVSLVTVPAVAQNGGSDYIFLVASGFLCDLGDSSACPGVVKSSQGDTYEMSGAGTLSTRSKSVTATGTFTHKSPDGGSLETGIWLASELVSFDSYGIAPGALQREGITLGPPPMGPRRMPALSGPVPAGGLAVLRIRLLPIRGGSRTALLQVNCALGKVPAERQTEGIRLRFEGGGEFDQELSGRTIFLLAGPDTSPRPSAPAPRVDSHGRP